MEQRQGKVPRSPALGFLRHRESGWKSKKQQKEMSREKGLENVIFSPVLPPFSSHRILHSVGDGGSPQEKRQTNTGMCPGDGEQAKGESHAVWEEEQRKDFIVS